MISINKNREVPAPIDLVWDVISNMNNEQKYWPILKDIKLLKRDGDTIEREATIDRGLWGKAKSLQTIIINPKEKSIMVDMTKGPMLGTRKITLDFLGEDKTNIEVAWEFEMKGIPAFALSHAENGVSKAIEDALGKIAEDTERMHRGPSPQSEGI